jgi:hypothetical protein
MRSFVLMIPVRGERGAGDSRLPQETRAASWKPPSGLPMVKRLRADWLAGVHFDWGEPAEAVGFETIGDAEEFVSDLLCDFSGFSVGDDNSSQ